MEIKKITDLYAGDNIEITANEATDVRLILTALQVYRNQLDTQTAISQGLRNGIPSPMDDESVHRERIRIDTMTQALRHPQSLPEVAESSLAS